MAWLSAALTMPQDAGIDRAGGPRLQMPNVQRQLVSGGIGWSFVADAILAAGGVEHTIPGGVFALCDDGGVALAIPAHYYVVYVTAAAPTVLRACRQEQWPTTYAAQDVYGLAYLTDHYDIYLPLAVAVIPATFYLLWGDLPPGAGSTAGQYGSPALAYPSPTALAQPEAAGRTAFDTLRSSQRLACGQDGTTLAVANDGTLWCCAPGTASPGTPVAAPTLFAGQTTATWLAVVASSADGLATTWTALLACSQAVAGGGVARRVVIHLTSTVAQPVRAADWGHRTLEDVTMTPGIVPVAPIGQLDQWSQMHMDANGTLDGIFLPAFVTYFADLTSRAFPDTLVPLPSPLSSVADPTFPDLYRWTYYANKDGTITVNHGDARAVGIALYPRRSRSTPLLPNGYNDVYNYMPYSSAHDVVFNYAPAYDAITPAASIGATVAWGVGSAPVTFTPTGGGAAVAGIAGGAGDTHDITRNWAYMQTDHNPSLPTGPDGTSVWNLLLVWADVDASVSTASFGAGTLTGVVGQFTQGEVSATGFGNRYPGTLRVWGTASPAGGNAAGGSLHQTAVTPLIHAAGFWTGPRMIETVWSPGTLPTAFLGVSPSGAAIGLQPDGTFSYWGETRFHSNPNQAAFAAAIPYGADPAGSLVPVRAGSTNPGPLCVGGALIIDGVADTARHWAGGCCDELAGGTTYRLYGIDSGGGLYRRPGNVGTAWVLVAAGAIPAGDTVLWMAFSRGAPPVIVSAIHGAPGSGTVRRTDIDTTTGIATAGAPVAFPVPPEVIGSQFAVAAAPILLQS